MKITITDGNSVSNFEVDNDQLVEDVKALLEAQTGIPLDRTQLYFEGKLLQNNFKLNQAGVTDGGLLFMVISEQKPKMQQQPQQQPKKGGLGLANMIKSFDKQVKENGGFNFNTISDAEYLKQAQGIYNDLLADQSKMVSLWDSEPSMAQCVEKKDVKGLAKILKDKRQAKLKKIMEEEKKFQQLSKDPMNPEYQRMLEQRIHQQNIDKNLQFAQEYIPEVFGHIHMLYIKASINKVPIQAFVDTGAQSTIMSESLANRCGQFFSLMFYRLMRLVDKRYAGTAVGVGSCKILGKIHAADMEIQGKYVTCSFTVIENNSVEFLLGLDMLKRFSCMIDLKRNELIFENGLIHTKFLSDGEIEKKKK